MDREGDIHEVLEAIADSPDGAVLRFEQNRRIDDPCAYARPAVQASPLLGRATVEVPRLYGLRWRVEDMHLVLKSGCAIEKLQLETADRLAKAVVLYSSIAVRIVQLRDWAREAPDTPCTELLQEGEWRALWTAIHKQASVSEQPEPTLHQAVLWIGRLGGHLNRKRDGLPGVKTLWRGWRDLMMLTDLYVVLRPPD